MNTLALDTLKFQNAMALVGRTLNSGAQLPNQIFSAQYSHFHFAQFDWMLFPECWIDLQVMLQNFDCNKLLVGALEPDPQTYFHHEFLTYQWWSIAADSSTADYSSVLSAAPVSSAVDSLLFNSERVCWIAGNGSFAIVGDRSHECAVFASRNKPKFDNLSHKWMSCTHFIDDGLLMPGHAPGFVDDVLKNYSAVTLT